MAYKLYMAGTLMPITPSKVTVKINNQNKTMTLINGEEINMPVSYTHLIRCWIWF